MHPNIPCAETKGLPVKLKVPSHVEVTISESFFIQASKNEGITPESPELFAAKDRVKLAEKTVRELTELSTELHRHALENPNNSNASGNATKALNYLKAANANLAEAQKVADGMQKTLEAAVKTPAECREIEVCIDGHPVRHFDVETRVIYTDKVFTVDFRRPAGGVLNLSAINMDDQQYFRQIKAAYEEQTLEQISGAIADISSGITGQSVGGMSATINGARVSGLATDERVVAVSRFDISDPNWEHQLNCFVDQHVTSHYTNCSYQN